jgi:hypothetical protein
MTDEQLEKINAERKKRGLLPLDKQHVQIERARYMPTSAAVPQTPPAGFNTFDFWVGYETGVGYTPEAMLGAMFHHQSDPAPSPSNDVSFTTPDPTPSYTSRDISRSYDSGSSSSSDSGSSGGGSD